MKRIVGLLMLLSGQTIFSQQAGEVYIFSYFKDNGQDGLHLAYSHDGLKWTALKNDPGYEMPLSCKYLTRQRKEVYAEL